MPNLDLPVEGYQQEPIADPNGYALPVAIDPSLQRVYVNSPGIEDRQEVKGPVLKEVEHDPWATGKEAIMKLFKGRNPVDDLINAASERKPTWPTEVLKEGLTSAGNIIKPNPYPENSEEYHWYEGERQKGMLPAALSISALAGTGGLAGAGEGTALGSAPMLRPALKYKDKIYKAPVNGQHMDAIPPALYDEFQKMAMSGEDISHYNFGFMNHKGQFLDREKALDYAVKEGLVDPSAGQYGALTSTLLADSSKPGTAIEAMAKAKPLEVKMIKRGGSPEVSKDTEVLVNPSKGEFLKFLKETSEGKNKGEVRTLADKDGNLHVWDANNSTHQGVIDGLRVKMNHDEDWGNHVVKIGDKLMASGNPKPMRGNPEWLNNMLKGKELFSDSSKPGAAIEANKPAFYSALEHNVGQIKQGKMTGDQWLGTLSNKPGVKPEELDWTGLKSFLEENKGKPVTKGQIEQHLAENKIEVGEKKIHYIDISQSLRDTAMGTGFPLFAKGVPLPLMPVDHDPFEKKK